ncbi:MAG: outer membrane protein assembly factor BamA [Verrucomicrobia bacterium]|nr:outer membrane protein assembly factor BamA [Verrucomicrobiota bacterium]
MNFWFSLSRLWIVVAASSAFLALSVRAQQPGPPPTLPSVPQPQSQSQPPAPVAPPPPGSRGGTQPAQAAPIVRQIEIQYAGPATLSRQRILSNMRTTVGQPYSEATVEEDVRSLYGTGLVTNVRIYGEPLPDGVKVIVVVQTRVTLSYVNILGNQLVSRKRIRRELNLKINSPLEEQQLEQARQKVVELYQKRGFPDVDVQYKTDVNEDRGTATVTFSISEGAKGTVHRVFFVGNRALKAKQLRKVMTTKPNNPIGFITGAGRFSSRQLDDDIQKIKELYQDNGYEDAQITDVRVDRLTRKKQVDITFYITEGIQYRVGTVTVEGLRVVSEPNFRKVLKVTEGKVFSPQKLQKDIKAVEDAYGVAGYADAKVNVETTPGGPGLVNLHYKIDEGIQSYVERINISGNTRTRDKVIRRELVLAPGDVFDTVRVEISKKRLEGLQYFERVDTYASDTNVPGRKDLNVVVTEKKTGNLNFGAGFSSTEGLLGFGEISQGNFDITNWRTFTGAGQKFRLRAQIGTEEKDVELSFTEPYFLDQRLALGFDAFYRDLQYTSDVYNQKEYGFDVFLRKPITTFLAAKLQYQLENVEIYGVTSTDPAITSQAGYNLESRVTLSLTYDKRDSAFLTRKGTRIDAAVYISGGPLGGDVNIYGFDLNAAQYFHLPFDTILTLNAEVAGVDMYNGSTNVPLYDRLYLGGADTLRGFKFRYVSPKDAEGDPIGGLSMARFTAEYTIPVIERVRVAVFYDTGFVNAGAWNFGTGNVNSDVGFGVRLNLPIGPLRIDYGIPIQSDRFNSSSGRFQFSVGYQF